MKLNTSVAIRIMRIKEQGEKQKQKQRSKGVLQDTQDLTVTYIIPVIYLIV